MQFCRLSGDRDHAAVAVNQVVARDIAGGVERINLALGVESHIERVAVFEPKLLDGCAFFVAGNGQEAELRAVEGRDSALDMLELGVAVGTSGREEGEEDDFPAQIVERDYLIVKRFDNERRREVAEAHTCSLLVRGVRTLDTGSKSDGYECQSQSM